ncbi:MAG TPA: c-type cytochrome [Longimicrobiales bacterium]|nr:c-type cytochrome [Longimicrobiales bacterium]
MWATNLRIAAVVLGTIGLYTVVCNAIPQVESEVPKEMNLSGAITPEQLVSAGEELFNGAGGCVACHGLGTRAPNLLTDEHGQGTIGARCGTRKPGTSCKDYLHESLVKPTAYVVSGYQPIMPDMSRTLSPPQIWALVAFLESQGGEVTVTAEDVKAAGAPAAGAAPPSAGPARSATMEPVALLRENTCLTCHHLGSEGTTIAPPFDHVGAGKTADYIRRSILDPNADTAKGYEKVAGIMPKDFGERLSAAQLESLVRYLAARK